MLFSTILAAALATTAPAQDEVKIPTCAEATSQAEATRKEHSETAALIRAAIKMSKDGSLTESEMETFVLRFGSLSTLLATEQNLQMLVCVSSSS